MVAVMNLTGYMMVGQGHMQSDVFPVISAHIVGMYGLVLVVGDLIDRLGRRVALVGGLAVMAGSTLGLAWTMSVFATGVALFGLGLGWSFSYVAATSELVDLALPAERGRLIGFNDLLSGSTGAALALIGGRGLFPRRQKQRCGRRRDRRCAPCALDRALRQAAGSAGRAGHVIVGTLPGRRTAVRRFSVETRMKTWNAKPGEIERRWYVVDAEGKTLGRLATQIADTLRGKGKPQYTPHVDTGDFVVVVNAEKIHVTGNKLDAKMYHRHSGYPGGLKSRPLRDELERRPTEVLRKAVKGMLPRNRLARAQLRKLKIYAGPEHPHEAQAPSELKVEA